MGNGASGLGGGDGHRRSGAGDLSLGWCDVAGSAERGMRADASLIGAAAAAGQGLSSAGRRAVSGQALRRASSGPEVTPKEVRTSHACRRWACGAYA